MKSRSEIPPRKPSLILQRLVHGPQHWAQYDSLDNILRLMKQVDSGALDPSTIYEVPRVYESSALQKIRHWLPPEDVESNGS
jgi:hypothetical protein